VDRHRNADGTFDGVGLLAGLSGLDRAEVKWMFERMVQLLRVEGKSRAEAKAIIAEEAKARPWAR
jgi:hypothetical protein